MKRSTVAQKFQRGVYQAYHTPAVPKRPQAKWQPPGVLHDVAWLTITGIMALVYLVV